MKAIVQGTYGSSDVLELRDIDKPEIGDDEVLVRVHAAVTRSSTIRVRIWSGPRPTNSCWKAIISSLMAASVLLCRRTTRCLHLLVCRGAATTKAGAAPHLYTHRGDAVTGPIR